MNQTILAIELLADKTTNSNFFDNLVGKLTQLILKKQINKEVFAFLESQNFYTDPKMSTVIEVVTKFGSPDPRMAITSSEVAGGYNIDAGAFALYYDETASRGHIVYLEDSVVTKKQKDRLVKINANVELSIPRFPAQPKKLTVKEMGDFVDADADIKKINPPVNINPLLKANALAEQYPLNWDQLVKGQIGLSKLPLWKFDETNETTYVNYYPVYKTHPADLKLLVAARAFMAIEPNSERSLYVYSAAERLRKAMLTYTYSNGTLEGQLNRYKIVSAVAEKCKALRGNPMYRGLNDQFKKTLQLALPLKRNHVRFDAGPITLLRRYGTTPTDFVKPPLSITYTADAGLLYGRSLTVVTRLQSQFADVDMAQLVYDLYGAMSDGKVEDVKKVKKSFIKAKNVSISTEKKSAYLYTESDLAKIFNTSRLCKLKPKAEIYSREELTTKTRNFSVQNAGFSNLAMMFFSQPFVEAPKWWEHKTSMSMLGWSPYYGGLSTVVNLMLDKDSLVWNTIKDEKVMKPLVYADNFWTVGLCDGEEYWYSVDGIKAEAHVTANDCKILVEHCANSYEKISKTWMRYMVSWYPVLSVNSIGVIAKAELPCEFLGSGSPGTAYLNTVATIDYVTALQNNTLGKWKEQITKDKEVKLGSWETAEKTSARTFKVEMKVKVSDFSNVNTELKIDLLGYSCISGRSFGMDGHWIPILDSQRLEKAICFLKSDLSAGEDSSPITLAINFFRYRVFYALGGWFDPGLAAILQTRCQTLKKQLVEIPSNVKLTEEMRALAQSLSFEQIPGNEYLIKFGSAINIPTLYDIIVLTLDKSALPLFINWCFNASKAKPWIYLPYSIFLEEAEVRNYKERPAKVMFGDDTSGTLVDTEIEAKIYEDVIAKLPGWGTFYDNSKSLSDWNAIDRIGRREEGEKTMPVYKGESISIANPGKNLLEPTSQGDVVSGKFSQLPPNVRKEVGSKLSPILSSALRSYTLNVEIVDDAESAIQSLKRISAFMETPLSIVKNALMSKTPQQGAHVKISQHIKDKYQLTAEYYELKAALSKLDLPSSLPYT